MKTFRDRILSLWRQVDPKAPVRSMATACGVSRVAICAFLDCAHREPPDALLLRLALAAPETFDLSTVRDLRAAWRSRMSA